MPELMTVEELGRYLRFTKKTIYKLLKQGNIPAIKIGNKWRFNKDAIDEWLRYSVETVKTRILVIDDDESIRSLFKTTLEEEGHTVVTADTGAKGLDYVKQQDFDLIFLDLKLPGADGAEVLHEMRSIKRGIPVVVITGYPDSEMMERAMRHGPLGVMTKPFSDSDIIAAINSFFHAAQKVR